MQLFIKLETLTFGWLISRDSYEATDSFWNDLFLEKMAYCVEKGILEQWVFGRNHIVRVRSLVSWYLMKLSLRPGKNSWNCEYLINFRIFALHVLHFCQKLYQAINTRIYLNQRKGLWFYRRFYLINCFENIISKNCAFDVFV